MDIECKYKNTCERTYCLDIACKRYREQLKEMEAKEALKEARKPKVMTEEQKMHEAKGNIKRSLSIRQEKDAELKDDIDFLLKHL